MDALRSHRAELAVVGGFAAAPEVEAEPLVEEEILVVGCPKLAGRWMSRRDAEAATWISPSVGSATQAAVEAAWADIGITPSHHLELPNWEAVKLAAARGDGVAGCSQFTVAAELRAGFSALFDCAARRYGGRSRSSGVARPCSRRRLANSSQC